MSSELVLDPQRFTTSPACLVRVTTHAAYTVEAVDVGIQLGWVGEYVLTYRVGVGRQYVYSTS